MAADYLNYVLSNPDLRENAEALGLTQAEMKEWGKTHWDNHGSKEGADGGGRQNSPTATAYQPGFTETLGAQHYQGRDPNEVLQRSVRSFYQGADADDYNMWESREGIDAGWNLGQYNSQGWNMASDNPYKTGILGNTIDVDTGVGQLYDTGDTAFLQDRYEDDSIANDFLPDWVTDGAWTGPEGLGDYWNALSTADRNAQGDLRSNVARPTTGWNPLTGMGDGLLNPTVPTFRGPAYQNWDRFMPTDFQLAEGGGRHYQQFVNPYMTGGGAFTGGGTFTGGGVNTGGGAGGGAGGGFTGVNTGGNNSGVTTDAQGRTWIMSNGQWIPTTSDLGSILAAGNTSRHPLGHYDSNGMWIGAEGPPGPEGNSPGFSSAEILSGIATDYGGKWGNRQVGLNMLGKMGILGPSFGVNPNLETSGIPGFTDPDFGLDDIEAMRDADNASDTDPFGDPTGFM